MADSSKRRGQEMKTTFGILSFPHLFTPRPRPEGQTGDPRYETDFIVKPAHQESEEHKALVDACVELAKANWPELYEKDPEAIRMPFKKGIKKDLEGYGDDDIFISPWSTKAPAVRDRNNAPILVADDVWAGQVARLSVTPWAYDTQGNKGVTLFLNGVIIAVAEAKRLDGRPSPDQMFKGTDMNIDEAALAAQMGVEAPVSAADDASGAAASKETAEAADEVRDELLAS